MVVKFHSLLYFYLWMKTMVFFLVFILIACYVFLIDIFVSKSWLLVLDVLFLRIEVTALNNHII
jgi:hypothetical protein